MWPVEEGVFEGAWRTHKKKKLWERDRDGRMSSEVWVLRGRELGDFVRCDCRDGEGSGGVSDPTRVLFSVSPGGAREKILEKEEL